MLWTRLFRAGRVTEFPKHQALETSSGSFPLNGAGVGPSTFLEVDAESCNSFLYFNGERDVKAWESLRYLIFASPFAGVDRSKIVIG